MCHHAGPMSGFLETQIHPLKKNEDHNKMNENIEAKGIKKQEQGDQAVSKPSNKELDLGPQLCFKEQPHKDQCVKSIPKRKELVLGSLNTSCVEDDSNVVPDVQIVKLSIVCPDRPEIAMAHPFISSPKDCLFTLKEGTKYRLKFSFIVSNKIVSGLKYENTLWKSGLRVDRSIVMLGTFKPHKNPFVYQLDEEKLPSGILVRGVYSARSKVVDDDGLCYMDIHYYFDIQKKWP